MNTAVPLKWIKPEKPNLPEHRDAFYGGQWHQPKSGRYAEIRSIPAPVNRLGRLRDCGAADIDAAVAAAKTAFDGWRRVPPLERAKMLQAHRRDPAPALADELAMIDAADCGNPYQEMVSDARSPPRRPILRRPRDRDEGQLDPDGAGRGQFLGARAARRGRPHHPVQSSIHVLRREIRGTAGGRQHRRIKPPEQAPLSSLRLVELIEGMLPPGVFNIVPGGREAGAALAGHPDVAMIALIGSVPTGRAVMRPPPTRSSP